MGLFEVMAGCVLEAVMSSDTKVGRATQKCFNYLKEEDCARQRREQMENRSQINSEKPKQKDTQYVPQKYEPIDKENKDKNSTNQPK